MTKQLRTPLLALAAWMLSLPLAADSAHTFPEAGKTYLIHRYADQNSYIYENGSLLCASPAMNTQKQYWQFEPTPNANCYYIRNVTTGHYVQSTRAAGCEQQISTGNTPVEFSIKQNTTSGAAPYGYYYIASTDQTLSTTGDTSLGLNYQQSTGKVVAYWIRYNRPNSYWDIAETDYDYQAPQPAQHTALQRRLGIYQLPCGTAGTAWLTSLSVSSTAAAASDKLAYTCTQQPSDYYLLVRRDSATIGRGNTLSLAYTANGADQTYAVTAYFDWDHDGIFEAAHEFGAQTAATATIAVPDTAALGVTRMRIRLTCNALEGADDEVEGRTYDCLLNITAPAPPTAIHPLPTTPLRPATHTPAYSTEGKRIKPDTHKGIYIQNGQKKIK